MAACLLRVSQDPWRKEKVDSSLLQGTHLLISIVAFIRFYGLSNLWALTFWWCRISRMPGFFIHSSQRHGGFFHALTHRSCHASDPFRLDIWKAKELYLQLPEWVRPGSVATCPHKKRGSKGEKVLNHRRAKNHGEKPWETMRNQWKINTHAVSSLKKSHFWRVNTEAYWWSTSQHRVLPVQIRDVCSRTRQAISLGKNCEARMMLWVKPHRYLQSYPNKV